MSLVLVALVGALGALGRYGLSFLPVTSGFPLAISLTNLLGAFVMGLVVGLSEEKKILSPNAALFWKVGVCGGFITFSLETVCLLDKEAYGLALFYSLSSVTLSLLALMLGRYSAASLAGGR